MTYNVLANCYSETSLAKEKLYPYCPVEFLEFKYRRILLIHEMKSTILNKNFTLISISSFCLF